MAKNLKKIMWYCCASLTWLNLQKSGGNDVRLECHIDKIKFAEKNWSDYLLLKCVADK
jgi:hypothetical protein